MTDRKREETALFRFGVIFPLLDERRSRGSLRRLVNEICSRQYEIPFSSRRVIRAGTVRTWYYRYLRDRRIETLMPKSRRDVGESRTVDLEAANELLRRHSENPDMPLTTLVRTMAEEGQTVKMHSAYRLVARCGSGSTNADERNQRRFEMESCNDCWMLDAMVGPKVFVEEGGSRRLVTAHCFAFMDDKSRLVTHAQFYLNERTESLLDCMWKAFNRRGLPVKDTPKRGRKVILNEEAVETYINGYSGFWIILTNAQKDASKALEHYNRRCDIEFHFDDMKNLLDCNRLNVHTEKTMKGRLFVNFITLILLNDLRDKVSAIKPRDRKYWDSKDMLNKVSTYSRIHFTGTYKDLWTVPTKAQRLIFSLLKIEYHWKGKIVNLEKPIEPEDDAEQGDEET